MALELIDALKQLFQCSFILMHNEINFYVGGEVVGGGARGAGTYFDF